MAWLWLSRSHGGAARSATWPPRHFFASAAFAAKVFWPLDKVVRCPLAAVSAGMSTAVQQTLLQQLGVVKKEVQRREWGQGDAVI